MNKQITRRDFLKFLSTLPLFFFVKPDGMRLIDRADQVGNERANIFVFLFDTFSAQHISLYGYSRETTPNLTRFAERANVYHRHYASSNFTTTGTASLLTGNLPWTHRALGHAGLVSKELLNMNLFHLIGDSYNRVGFSQNLWADILLEQFEKSIDQHLNPTDFSLISSVTYANHLNSHISLEIFREFDDFLLQNFDRPGSLIFSFLEDFDFALKYKKTWDMFADQYPRGIPNLPKYNIAFLLEQVFDGIMAQITQIAKPAFAYFHLYSPHEPYHPHRDFVGIFDDDWKPTSKKPHPLVPNGFPDEALIILRRQYDEYIANVDAEFGRLLDFLDSTGYLENSYIVLTSDHGQAFERGLHGHTTELLYEPLIKVPLLISSPSQKERKDFHVPTSCIDLLPTLLKISDQSINGCEGLVLPGFGGQENEDRPIFSMVAKTNPVYAPLTKATVAMIKGDYKLIWYGDYPDYRNVYELYNLEDDPEEMNDLYDSRSSLSQFLQKELQGNLEKFDKYKRPNS